jgi:hypothetical protein
VASKEQFDVLLRSPRFRGQNPQSLPPASAVLDRTTFTQLPETGSPPTDASWFCSESIIAGTMHADGDRKHRFWIESVPWGLAS